MFKLKGLIGTKYEQPLLASLKVVILALKQMAQLLCIF